MNFLKQFLKLGSLVLVVALIMVGAVSYSFKNKKAENAYAGTGENMSGFAWSENIGWVSFNNTTGGGGTSYGVNIQETDIGSGNTIGKLSGYAWSENIGWITFNRDNANTPPKSDPGAGLLAYIDSDGKTVKGWARAMSACNDTNSDGKCDDSGAGTNSGGWDGWIALGDMNTGDAYSYGATLDTLTKQFKGWAWDGSDTGIIGWLSFNKLNCDSDNNGKVDVACGSDNSSTSIGDYKVSTTFELNLPPNKPDNLNIEDTKDGVSRYCRADYGNLRFTWNFTDPNNSETDAGKQKKYEIKACYGSTCTPSTKIKEEDNTAVEFTDISLDTLNTELGSWYDQTLRWTITVWDKSAFSKSNTSDISSSHAMPNREYPVVDFNSNPVLDQIFAEQDVQFSDNSICYTSGATGSVRGCKSFEWSFTTLTEGTDYKYKELSDVLTTKNSQDILVEFLRSVVGAVPVKLQVWDGAGKTGYTCSTSKNITKIGTAIPKFEEKK